MRHPHLGQTAGETDRRWSTGPTVGLVDPLNHFFALLMLELKSISRGSQHSAETNPLEQQLGARRVDRGDAEHVADRPVGCPPPRLRRKDLAPPRLGDDRMDGQEIWRVIELCDEPEFIRFFLDQHRGMRDRLLFALAIDSKLRSCDVVKVRIGDLILGRQVRARTIVVQAKAGKWVQSELMQDGRTGI
ncbi:MAG: Integrase family protein, partial [Sphingomonas bacterium]|nr:Integrase family protein [Sphingomonas bacterium]